MITEKDLFARDFELLIDKSGSMGTARDCPGGKTRWEYAKETTEAIAHKAAQYDDDGINVLLFAGSSRLYENQGPEIVSRIFSENDPSGGTDTAGALSKRLDAYFERVSRGRAKPLTLVVVTDGLPDDERAVANVIVSATKRIKNDDDIGILFLQIGKDAGARRFLKQLDDELESRGAKFDIVSTKTCDELENMTIAEALVAAVNE